MFACPSRLLVVLMACTLALAIPVDDNALQQGDVVRVRGKALQPPESGSHTAVVLHLEEPNKKKAELALWGPYVTGTRAKHVEHYNPTKDMKGSLVSLEPKTAAVEDLSFLQKSEMSPGNLEKLRKDVANYSPPSPSAPTNKAGKRP